MNCNKVTHLLSAFMDGELLGYEHRLIHQHLQQCEDCRNEYEELLQMKRLLAAMRFREPGQRLAATITERVLREPESTMARMGPWKAIIPGLQSRPVGYSPVIGLGVGLTFFGLMFLAHPTNTAGSSINEGRALEFQTADIARDVPAPRVDELTNGLMRESAPQPVSYESRYTDDLPDFPLAAHEYRQARKSSVTTLLFR